MGYRESAKSSLWLNSNVKQRKEGGEALAGQNNSCALVSISQQLPLFMLRVKINSMSRINLPD